MTSIIKFSKQGLKHIDIVVLTNEKHASIVSKFARKNNVDVTLLIIGHNPDKLLFSSRMRRLDIFDCLEVSHYEIVMHMDYDCIVHKDLWEHVFQPNLSLLKPGVIYSYREEKMSGHKKIFYSFNSYTKDERKAFRDDNVYPFSTGIFMFKPCPLMQKNLERAAKCVLTNLTRDHFYEQSGVNVFFNMSRLSNTKKLRHLVEGRNIKPNISGQARLRDWDLDTRIAVTHFCGIGYYSEKIQRMRSYLAFLEKLSPCIE